MTHPLLTIYAAVERQLPERSCTQRTCCCLLEEAGHEPYVTAAELELMVVELRRQGRRVPPPRPDGACPLLAASGDGCSVYSARPLGCRTYFCREAGGPVPLRAVRTEVQALKTLDEATTGKSAEGRPLRSALEAVRKGTRRS